MGNCEGAVHPGGRPDCSVGRRRGRGPDGGLPTVGVRTVARDGLVAAGAARPLLRHLPQRADARAGRSPVRLRRARRIGRRLRSCGVGGGRPQAAARDDAPAGAPAAGARGPRAVRNLARIRARPRGGGRAVPGPARGPPPDDGRVRQRRPRPAGPRRRRALAAVPGRRRRPAGIRHERRRAVGLPRAVRALPGGRQPDQPPRGGRPDDRTRLRRRHLQHPEAALPGRPGQRGAAVRLARGDVRPSLLPPRRRLRGPHPAAPDDLRLRRRHGPLAPHRGAARRRPRRALHRRRRGPRRLSVGLQLLRHDPRRPGLGELRLQRRRCRAHRPLPGRGRAARDRPLVRRRPDGTDRRARTPAVGVLAERARLLPRQRGGRADRGRRPLRSDRPRRHAEPAEALLLPAREPVGGRRSAMRRRHPEDARAAGPTGDRRPMPTSRR